MKLGNKVSSMRFLSPKRERRSLAAVRRNAHAQLVYARTVVTEPSHTGLKSGSAAHALKCRTVRRMGEKGGGVTLCARGVRTL